MYSVLRKSCLVFVKESHVSLEELRNMGIKKNEPLCFSVSKSFGEVSRDRREGINTNQ